MRTILIAVITLACTFGSAFAGEFLSRKLPDETLSNDSKDAVKLVMGLIATMSALLLSLLLASAQTTYNAQNANVEGLAAAVLQMDRMLELYGPAAEPLRKEVHEITDSTRSVIWEADGVHSDRLNPIGLQHRINNLLVSVLSLPTDTNLHRFAQAQFIRAASEASTIRINMFEQSRSRLPLPFLVVVIAWLSFLFMGFGLLSPFHRLVRFTFLVGAVSVSAAIFMIIELSSPYSGLIQLSDAPIVAVLEFFRTGVR